MPDSEYNAQKRGRGRYINNNITLGRRGRYIIHRPCIKVDAVMVYMDLPMDSYLLTKKGSLFLLTIRHIAMIVVLKM